MKILVDTNVVLDLLLVREPFTFAAAQLFAMVERSIVDAYLCATTITTVDYLLNRSLPKKEAQKALHQLLELFEIAPVNRPVLEEGLHSKLTDFEDAVLAYAANMVNVETIVTRNTKDFRYSPVKVIDPIEFLAIMNLH